MIKDTENVIAVTATEKATVSNFFFLFRFFLIEQNKNFVIQLTKDNGTSDRYDRFILDLPDDLNLPSGDYHYFIYQSLEDGNLDWDGLLELENGKAIVPTDEPTLKQFEGNGIDYTFEISWR